MRILKLGDVPTSKKEDVNIIIFMMDLHAAFISLVVNGRGLFEGCV